MYGDMSRSGELSGCAKCIRLLFIICNIPILLCGLASLGIGIWLVIVESQIEEVLSEVNARIGAALFIVSGVLLMTLSCIGFLGSCCKSRVLMFVYLIAIFVIIVLEIAAAGYAFARSDEFDREQLETDLLEALRRYYPTNSTNHDDDLNRAVDAVQERFKCCGVVNGTEDWFAYSNYSITLMRLPASCCGRDEPQACPEADAYSDPCLDAFFDFIQQNLLVTGIIGVIFAVYEVSILIMSCVLLVYIHKAHKGDGEYA